MKVFLSWSGERSKEAAALLHDKLRFSFDAVRPWMSDADIVTGERWLNAISSELNDSDFGIIFLTPENVRSEWVMFEAGAISKSIASGRVIPVLIGLEYSDLSGPLSQFQSVKFNNDGLGKILGSVNAALGNPKSDQHLLSTSEVVWSSLSEKVERINNSDAYARRQPRPQAEVLNELVNTVHDLSRAVRDVEAKVGEDNLNAPKFQLINPKHITIQQARPEDDVWIVTRDLYHDLEDNETFNAILANLKAGVRYTYFVRDSVGVGEVVRKFLKKVAAEGVQDELVQVFSIGEADFFGDDMVIYDPENPTLSWGFSAITFHRHPQLQTFYISMPHASLCRMVVALNEMRETAQPITA